LIFDGKRDCCCWVVVGFMLSWSLSNFSIFNWAYVISKAWIIIPFCWNTFDYFSLAYRYSLSRSFNDWSVRLSN
jgi:hypothetical protein